MSKERIMGQVISINEKISERMSVQFLPIKEKIEITVIIDRDISNIEKEDFIELDVHDLSSKTKICEGDVYRNILA